MTDSLGACMDGDEKEKGWKQQRQNITMLRANEETGPVGSTYQADVQDLALVSQHGPRGGGRRHGHPVHEAGGQHVHPGVVVELLLRHYHRHD